MPPIPTHPTATIPLDTPPWQEALARRRQAPPAPHAAPEVDRSRRRFIRTSFLSGLGLALLGSVGVLTDYLYPRGVRGFGGPVPAGLVTDYRKGGEPKHFVQGQFWIMNLDPAEDRPV